MKLARSSALINGLVTGWIFLSRFFLAVPAVVFVFLFIVLLLNASSGFDITDESYYLLWADQPENVIAPLTVNQFGFYTKMLFLLSGENITAFRITGIISLLCMAGMFAVAADRYWTNSAGIVSKRNIRWSGIGLILVSTLVYYSLWLLTPSYNWLALFCVLVVATGLLRMATTMVHGQTAQRIHGEVIINALLVGFGGGIAFMAKPTTAMILALTTIYWILVHKKTGSWKEFFLISFGVACLALLMHAIFFNGGVLPFVSYLNEGIRNAKILDAGHTLGTMSARAIDDFQQAALRIIGLSPETFMALPVVVLVVRWLKRENRHKTANFVLSSCLMFIILNIAYNLWELQPQDIHTISYGALTLLSVLLLCTLAVRLSGNIIHIEGKRIPFKQPVRLVIFFCLLATAFAFGSANGFIRQMSWAYLFIAAGSLYTAYWIDHKLGGIVLSGVVSLLITLFAVLPANHGYNHPYRLPEKISQQVVKTSFLTGKGHLFVDQPTADYINDLKHMAGAAHWKPGTPLIDITGASPGVSVILGARILETPWFIGGYSGSDQFVKNILQKAPAKLKQDAWVMTTPYGKQRIPDSILTDIGLNFPGEYAVVGTTMSGHRNEFQVLWRPVRNDQESINGSTHAKKANPSGYGLDYEFFKNRYLNMDRPAHRVDFNAGIQNAETIDFKQWLSRLPLVSLQGVRGDFSVKAIAKEGKSGVRIISVKNADIGSKTNKVNPVLLFGPLEGRNGFTINKHNGKYLIMSATVRAGRPNSIQIFIADKADKEKKWDITTLRSGNIDGKWHEYFVIRKIDPRRKEIRGGVRWDPESDEDFLDIRDMKVYISDGPVFANENETRLSVN